MSKSAFKERPKADPKIYGYSVGISDLKGQIKIGQTNGDPKERIKQQHPIVTPLPDAEIVFCDSAMRTDGSTFTDREIHNYLKKKGIKNTKGEWFECTTKELQSAFIAVKNRETEIEDRYLDYKMRPEQSEAVEKTSSYFNAHFKDNPKQPPHFLWNAKMRFGKTFTSYQLAKKMGWTKILVLTFKPAVQNTWEEDIKSHYDFTGWQFIAPNRLKYEDANKDKPFVCFGSFQDYLQKNSAGGIKPKNEWVHKIKWDCVILDEYHFGAWRNAAKELFQDEDKDERTFAEGEGLDYFDEQNMPIKTKCYLYLSGTPFRAIASGDFDFDQIYNWTYSDEQRAKKDWKGENNPYAALPQMMLLTYKLPDTIRQIALRGENNQFQLNEFFSATGVKDAAQFKHKDEVQKWLDLMRNAFLETTIDNLKLGAQKPALPFSEVNLLKALTHTLWLLPGVASCYAMRNLLSERQNIFYQDYKVVLAAGPQAGVGVKALAPLEKALDNPLKTKTITLSCGKLTTGVTVKPWAGIFMLLDLESPETYFQSAFRVQSPWTIKNPDGDNPREEIIIKPECYVFDFAPNRALVQIVEYSSKVDIEESDIEKRVQEFISFLPVLAYDGSIMKPIDAEEILDMATSGTTAKLLAERWGNACLVNVDDNTIRRLLGNKKALDALMKIEDFRALKDDLEIIINKTESIRKLKNEANEKDLSDREKATLTKDEKDRNSLRTKIQKKLRKFATRVPVFMYLTDYRERTLKDVITQLEPALFKKVTALEVKDFELLISLGVFNSSLMNEAVYKFKKYEDASLNYAGLSKHNLEKVGLYDTVISTDEYNTGMDNS